MRFQNVYTNDKMTSIWVFFGGLIAVSGLVFIMWIIVYKGWCISKQGEKTCRHKKVLKSVLPEKQKVTITTKVYKQNPKCPARRHKNYGCMALNPPKNLRSNQTDNSRGFFPNIFRKPTTTTFD